MKPLANIVETPMYPNKWKIVPHDGIPSNAASNYFRHIDDAKIEVKRRGYKLDRVITFADRERIEKLEADMNKDAFLDWMFKNCRIIYYPENLEYPIEHVPNVKNSRHDIERVMMEKMKV